MVSATVDLRNKSAFGAGRDQKYMGQVSRKGRSESSQVMVLSFDGSLHPARPTASGVSVARSAVGSIDAQML